MRGKKSTSLEQKAVIWGEERTCRRNKLGSIDGWRFQIAQREIRLRKTCAGHILKLVFYKEVFLNRGVHSGGRRSVTCLEICLKVIMFAVVILDVWTL